MPSDAPSERRLSGFRHIRYETGEGIAHIILDRQEKLNALGFGPNSNRREISDAVAAANLDDSVGCILITAAGQAFCAGGDLEGLPPRETVPDNVAFGRQLELFYQSLRSSQKPILAAVHGLCLGAGLGFIAQCDIVIASEDARFGLVEGRMGMPGAGELVPRIGPAWAKFMIWTGEIIEASLAERMGLVMLVLSREELLERTTDLARRIARVPRSGVLLNKLAIDNIADAAGGGLGRLISFSQESMTRAASSEARAPDGRRFDDIIRDEGIEGLKQAQRQQFTGSWLKPS